MKALLYRSANEQPEYFVESSNGYSDPSESIAVSER